MCCQGDPKAVEEQGPHLSGLGHGSDLLGMEVSIR